MEGPSCSTQHVQATTSACHQTAWSFFLQSSEHLQGSLQAMRTAPATCLLYSLIQEHVSQSGLSTKHLEKFRKRQRDDALAKKRKQAAEQFPAGPLHPDDNPDNEEVSQGCT